MAAKLLSRREQVVAQQCRDAGLRGDTAIQYARAAYPGCVDIAREQRIGYAADMMQDHQAGVNPSLAAAYCHATLLALGMGNERMDDACAALLAYAQDLTSK